MMRIAVIGTGISGSLAARLLSTQHDVTVFEANDYLGGHANTVDVAAFGRRYSVDTGFMVFNRRTYPNFCRLLQLLKVESQPSNMSFSVFCGKSGLEYQGSSLNGLFAQRSNCLRPSFLGMLRDIQRFNRLSLRAAASGELKDGRNVGQFLRECHVGKHFVEQYFVPMAAAIWSSRPESIEDFPAEFMIGFFANHGLLQIADRPQWRTIVGGSRCYIAALLEPLMDRILLRSPVFKVLRQDDSVQIELRDGAQHDFDQVVFATHSDQALGMLADATPAEREILGSFRYHCNEAVLHTDTNCLPTRSRAWASWNYHIPPEANAVASITYDLSRLQSLDSSSPLLLTLNDTARIDPAKVLRTFCYDHPGYGRDSIIAQSKVDRISGQRRTHYCGAYWGYGFHEDGVNSALRVARSFGLGLEACTVASTRESSRIAVASR
jgi:predicted NAD/FAD-binding protein